MPSLNDVKIRAIRRAVNRDGALNDLEKMFWEEFDGTTGGGAGALLVATRSDNNQPAVFSDFSALETYTATPDGTTDAARINVSDADLAEEVFALGTLDGNDQVESITAAFIRLDNAWVSVATNIAGTPGAPGQDGQADLTGLTDQRVPFNNAGSLEDSPIRVMSDGSAFVQGITRIESGTLAVGPFVEVSERGGFLGLTNAFGDEFTFVDYRTPRGEPSSAPRLLEYTEAENNFDIQTVQTESLSSPVSFQYTPTMLARTNALLGQVGTDVTNLRFRVTNVNDVTQVLKYWPSEAAWLDGTGEDFVAGQIMIDFEDTELPLNQNTTLQIDIRFDSGTLLGDTNGVPALTAILQRGQFADVALDRQLVDGISAEVSGQALTISLSRGGTLSDLMATVNIPAGGSTPAPGNTSASITRFEIAGQPTSVLAGTELSGTKTFNYNVNHPEDVSGNLSLVQNGVVLRSDISPSGNTFTHAITAQTLNNNQQAVFELRGITNENIAIQMFFRVRAHLPAEQMFYGLSNDNNAPLVDLSTLSHTEAGIDSTRVSTGTTASNQYFMILVPQDHDLVRVIDGLGQNVTNIFTKTTNVRQVSGVQYNSYVFGPVNAGASEDYIVRF